MKHYTETISADLAKKLKEKGMPMTLWQNGNNTDYIEVLETRQEIFDESQTYEIGVRFQLPTYAEVLDWFMNKNVRVSVHTYPAREPFAWGYILWTMDGIQLYDPNPMPHIMGLVCYPTWHEVVDAAITKALELIK